MTAAVQNPGQSLSNSNEETFSPPVLFALQQLLDETPQLEARYLSFERGRYEKLFDRFQKGVFP